MHANSQPLVMLYGYSDKKNELSFVGRKGIITLSGRVKKIKQILRLCNGLTSVNDISMQLSLIDPEEVLELLNLCETQGIVRDSRELYVSFHEDSVNPPMFSYDLGANGVALVMQSERLRERSGESVKLSQPSTSVILDTLRKRQTIRQFKIGQIPSNKLSGLLEASYGFGDNSHWSVPSGGAMYPLDLYLIIPNDDQILSRGIYRWNPEKHILIKIFKNDPSVWLCKVFNAKALLENVSGIICVAASMVRSGLKYANSAYRLMHFWKLGMLLKMLTCIVQNKILESSNMADFVMKL